MQTTIRNNKGFTLIEMAIVLVIIGIIIGAVVKGQDLIVNAQAKQVTSAVNSWRSLIYAFQDRNGRFPGDQSRNGIMGDASGETGTTVTSINELENAMQNLPANPVVIGSMAFFVFPGYATPAATTNRNCLLICKDAECKTTFTADEIEIIKSIDSALDGGADAGMGQFRGITAATTPVSATSPTVPGNRTNATATATVPANILGNGTAVVGTTVPWTAGTGAAYAAVWLFDRPFP